MAQQLFNARTGNGTRVHAARGAGHRAVAALCGQTVWSNATPFVAGSARACATCSQAARAEEGHRQKVEAARDLIADLGGGEWIEQIADEGASVLGGAVACCVVRLTTGGKAAVTSRFYFEQSYSDPDEGRGLAGYRMLVVACREQTRQQNRYVEANHYVVRRTADGGIIVYADKNTVLYKRAAVGV